MRSGKDAHERLQATSRGQDPRRRKGRPRLARRPRRRQRQAGRARGRERQQAHPRHRMLSGDQHGRDPAGPRGTAWRRSCPPCRRLRMGRPACAGAHRRHDHRQPRVWRPLPLHGGRVLRRRSRGTGPGRRLVCVGARRGLRRRRHRHLPRPRPPAVRRPHPLGDPAAPARRHAQLEGEQRRRGRRAQVQARLLLRMAHGRPHQAGALRPRGLRARDQRARRAQDGAGRRLPRGPRPGRTPALPPGALLRYERLGRPLDAGTLRARPRRTQLWLGLRRRARGEQRDSRLRWRAPGKSPPST